MKFGNLGGAHVAGYGRACRIHRFGGGFHSDGTAGGGQLQRHIQVRHLSHQQCKRSLGGREARRFEPQHVTARAQGGELVESLRIGRGGCLRAITPGGGNHRTRDTGAGRIGQLAADTGLLGHGKPGSKQKHDG